MNNKVPAFDRKKKKEKKNNLNTTNLDGCFKFQKIGLRRENLLGKHTQLDDLRLRQLHLFPRPPSHFKKPIDYVVKERGIHFLLYICMYNVNSKGSARGQSIGICFECVWRLGYGCRLDCTKHFLGIQKPESGNSEISRVIEKD